MADATGTKRKRENDLQSTPDTICYVPLTTAATMSKTERRRLTKQLKKVRVQKASPSEKKTAQGKGAIKGAEKLPKMTKEERREKFTKKALEARDRLLQRPQAGPDAWKSKKPPKVFCLGCKKKGHRLADCPEAASQGTSICFNCGSPDHPLRRCPKPVKQEGRLPFATCFVCKEAGHLSSQCSQNEHGVYPRGGECHICGSKYHLVSKCPEKGKGAAVKRVGAEDEDLKAGQPPRDLPDPMDTEVERPSKAGPKPTRPAPAAPAGGDDLGEDDYLQQQVEEDIDTPVKPVAKKQKGGLVLFAPNKSGSAALSAAKKKPKVVKF